ncbi:PsbP-related protein [Brevibacillus sp. FIR094]|uniref:PsbP-related protein n=1 Tax=Brevibacillus sp. FIR094 TaxID=3134809 RepID=UPI003D1B5057
MKLFRHLRILIQCFFVMSFLLGCSQTNKPIETTEFIKYEDKSNNFAISYPKGWSFDCKQKDVSVLFNSPKENDQDAITESISVKAIILPFEATAPWENYKDGIIEMIKKGSPGIEVQNTTKLKINEYEAMQILFKGKYNNENLAFQMTYVIKGKMGYIINFTSLYDDLEKYASTIEKVTNSFEILE